MTKHFFTTTRWLVTIILLTTLAIGHAWGTSVTYSVSSTSAVNTSGTAPANSSAALSGEGSKNGDYIQCTNGKYHTLTLTGYAGHKITAITIHVRSNSSSGTGSFTVTAGSTTIASIAESAFDSDNWNGAWNNTTGVDKSLTMTNYEYEIQESENVTLTLSCKSGNSSYNSLYVSSYSITYEAVSGGAKIDIMYAKGFSGYTTNSTSAAGTDRTAVANSTNATGVTYAMQSYNGSTGAVKGNGTNAVNFNCRNTTTYSGYYISKVQLTVSGGSIDGSVDGRSLVYFGSSAYTNPNTTAPSGDATTASPASSGQSTLTWTNSDESASYFILYNLKTYSTAISENATTSLKVTWTQKSAASCTADPTAGAAQIKGSSL